MDHFNLCASPDYVPPNNAHSPPLDQLLSEIDEWNQGRQLNRPVATQIEQEAAVQAAPELEAGQALYQVPLAIQPASVGDAGLLADEQMMVDDDLEAEFWRNLGGLRRDLELDLQRGQSSEAGPSNPQNFQPIGPLEGFMRHAVPPVQGLSTPIYFTRESVTRAPQNLRGLSAEDEQRFGGIEVQLEGLFQVYERWYMNGLRIDLGPPRYWLQISAEGFDANEVATRFQRMQGLDENFMRTVNFNVNGGDVTRFSDVWQMMANLPTYQGVAHFWIQPGSTTSNRIYNIFSRGGRSWFDLSCMCGTLKTPVQMQL